MSKTLTASVSAHIAGNVTTLSTCWKVIRADGVILGFTDCISSITVSSISYEPKSGYTPSSLETNSELSVDNIDVAGLLNSDSLTAQDIEAGKYDGADVYIFFINRSDPSSGIIPAGRGKLGNVELNDETYVAEYRSLTAYLQQRIGESFTDSCRADLGDARCKVGVDPDVWQASTAYATAAVVSAVASYTGRIFVARPNASAAFTSTVEPSWNLTIGASTIDNGITWTTHYAYSQQVQVTSVINAREFYATALVSVAEMQASIANANLVGLASGTFASVEASGYFDNGLVSWASGTANATYSKEVKSYTSDGKISLYEAMPFLMTVGEVFTIYPGCKKRFIEDCRSKYNNVVNFRGEPYIPGLDEVRQFGGQT